MMAAPLSDGGPARRLFTALIPPRRVREAIVDALPDTSGVRWMPSENLHVTLAFHGAVRDVDVLVERVRAVTAGVETVRMRIAQAGSFDAHRGVPVWIGADGAAESDRSVLRGLAAACGGQKRFVPHITLARARRSGLAAALAAVAAIEPIEYVAEAVSVVESRLGEGAGGRSLYTERAVLPLRPRG